MSENIAELLNRLQADYQVLYQKARTYHWTVTGPHFFTLHKEFESMYTELAERIDEIAERTAAIGGRPVPTLAAQLQLARLKEDEGSLAAEAMVRSLSKDLTQLNQQLRELAKSAGKAGDTATANLADGMADKQEKTIWMLSAFSM